jgi:hypothetical protein
MENEGFNMNKLRDLQKVSFADFWLRVKQDKKDWQIPECPCCGERNAIRIRIDTEGNADAVQCYAQGCGWSDYSSHDFRMFEVEA